MSKKIITGAAVIIFLLFFLTRSMALEGLEKKKVPDALNPGLDHLLALVSPDNKQGNIRPAAHRKNSGFYALP